MSSPRTPRTPRRSRTPRNVEGTPTNSRDRDEENSDIATPLRWGTARRNGAEASSPPQNVAATSPAPGFSEIDLSSPLNYGTPSSLGSIRTPRSGIRGTPIRMRPDIRTDKRIRQVNVGSDALEPIPENREGVDGPAPSHLVIWGTDVSVAECKEKFKQFILRYIDPTAEEDELGENTNLNEPLYLQKLEEVSFLLRICRYSIFPLYTVCQNLTSMYTCVRYLSLDRGRKINTLCLFNTFSESNINSTFFKC